MEHAYVSEDGSRTATIECCYKVTTKVVWPSRRDKHFYINFIWHGYVNFHCYQRLNIDDVHIAETSIHVAKYPGICRRIYAYLNLLSYVEVLPIKIKCVHCCAVLYMYIFIYYYYFRTWATVVPLLACPYAILCRCYINLYAIMDVTKAPFANFPLSKLYDLAKLPVASF